MELLAVIMALQKIKQPGHQVNVYSDSKYVVDPIEKSWLQRWQSKGFAGRKNPDLWRQLLPLLKQHQPRFFWVKGHNNHPQNERCDQLAVAASKAPHLAPDHFFEQSAG